MIKFLLILQLHEVYMKITTSWPCMEMESIISGCEIKCDLSPSRPFAWGLLNQTRVFWKLFIWEQLKLTTMLPQGLVRPKNNNPKRKWTLKLNTCKLSVMQGNAHKWVISLNRINKSINQKVVRVKKIIHLIMKGSLIYCHLLRTNIERNVWRMVRRTYTTILGVKGYMGHYDIRFLERFEHAIPECWKRLSANFTVQ